MILKRRLVWFRFLIVLITLTTLIVFASCALGNSDIANSKGMRASSILKLAGQQLDEIEQTPQASFAKSEIAIARGWIKEGKKLLKHKKLRKATIVAERMSSQILLIRAIIKAGQKTQETLKSEQNIYELKKRIKILKAKYNNLIIDRKGTFLTDAYPHKETSNEK